jgi:hypothetical protein
MKQGAAESSALGCYTEVLQCKAFVFENEGPESPHSL